MQPPKFNIFISRFYALNLWIIHFIVHSVKNFFPELRKNMNFSLKAPESYIPSMFFRFVHCFSKWTFHLFWTFHSVHYNMPLPYSSSAMPICWLEKMNLFYAPAIAIGVCREATFLLHQSVLDWYVILMIAVWTFPPRRGQIHKATNHIVRK